MNTIFTMRDFLRDPKGVDAQLAAGGTLRLTPREVLHFNRGIRSISFSSDAIATMRSLGEALHQGGSATIDRAVLEGVGATIEPEDPGDVEYSAITGFEIGVLAGALVLGVALGFFGSDAADSNSPAIEVTNEGGDVTVNVGGNGGNE